MLPLQHSTWATLYLMGACAHTAQDALVCTRHGQWCRVNVNMQVKSHPTQILCFKHMGSQLVWTCRMEWWRNASEADIVISYSSYACVVKGGGQKRCYSKEVVRLVIFFTTHYFAHFTIAWLVTLSINLYVRINTRIWDGTSVHCIPMEFFQPMKCQYWCLDHFFINLPRPWNSTFKHFNGKH